MRNINFLVIILTCLFLYNCSNDDDENQEDLITDNDLYGTWTFQILRSEIEVDLNNDGIKNNNLFEELNNCFKDNSFVFTEETGGTNVFQMLDNQIDCNNSFFSEQQGTFNIDGNNSILFNFPSDLDLTYNWTNVSYEKENNVVTKISFFADDFELGFADGTFDESCCADVTLVRIQ